MKTFRLTIVVVASALSLGTAIAMPDLGRETGRFIRKDQSVPKDVRTFGPTESTGSKSDKDFAMRFFQPGGDSIRVAITMPTRPPADRVAITMPTRPPADRLVITMPTHPPKSSRLA